MEEFNKTDGNMTWNWTLTTTVPGGDLERDAIWYFLASCTVLLGLVACVCNAIVLKALNALSDDKMKVKFLLKNTIAGDILLSVSIAFRTACFMAGFWENREYGDISSCTNLVFGFYAYFSAFYQIFATMAVAFDRFHSVLNPLRYHTMVYTNKTKIAVMSLILGITLALSLPTILLKFEPGKSLSKVCESAYERSIYADVYLPYVIIFLVFFTMLVYCSIFLRIAYHRVARAQILGENTDDQNMIRKQVSLAITFFMIHITYVLLYIPGALYFSILSSSLASQPNLNSYLSQISLMIYLLNTVADPLIYISRIKSIRANVKSLFDKKERKTVYAMEHRQFTDAATSVN